MTDNAPRVIVIGGPPGAEKSTLGRALAAELGYGNRLARRAVGFLRSVFRRVE